MEVENVMAVRTLYECSHARVHDSRIYCDKGHRLSGVKLDGSLEVNRLERDMPLAIAICQNCPDFDCMGTPVQNSEKGWLK
jgi:hypothetical protein